MNDLKALEQKYKELGEEIARQKAEQGENAWPCEGDTIFVLVSDGSIVESTYYAEDERPFMLSQGNLFRTREHAAKECNARAVIQKLRNQPGRRNFIADRNNYSIYYDLGMQRIDTNIWIVNDRGWQSIYFDSPQSLEVAIQKVEEERIIAAMKWLCLEKP